MKTSKIVLGLAAAGLLLATAVPARATLQIQKDAKAAGIAGIDNCMSCHVDKMPKKGASALNDKGKWLLEKKAEKKADKIDVAWLKDYVAKK